MWLYRIRKKFEEGLIKHGVKLQEFNKATKSLLRKCQEDPAAMMELDRILQKRMKEKDSASNSDLGE